MRGNTNPASRLLGRAEVAEIFGVSPSTITRWADAGMLPVVKTLGGHRRYDSEAVLRLAQQFLEEKATMEEVIFGVPDLYADHHVLTVRDVLLGIDGVEEVRASSAFKTVQVRFDANQASAQIIAMALIDAGYPPAGLRANGKHPVPISAGKKDPAWDSLVMRTVETNVADIAMSGEFRKY